MASSQTNRGTCHWASKKKMGQIIFGVQNPIPRVDEGLQAGNSDLRPQVGQLNRLFSPAQILSQHDLGAGGNTLFPFYGCFKRNCPLLQMLRHTQSSHTLANGIWELGQAGWGTSLAPAGKLQGGAGKPRPTAAGAFLQDRLPWVWPGYLSTWARPKSQVQTSADACCSPTPQ